MQMQQMRRTQQSTRATEGALFVLLALGCIVPVARGAHTSVPTDGAHAQSGRTGAPRTPGYLGIVFHDLTDEDAAAIHLRNAHGIEVMMVDHDGPAGRVLRLHDVILSVNGQQVPSAEMLRKMIRDAGAGSAWTMGIMRDGQAQTVSVTLAERADVEREARARMAAVDPAAQGTIVEGFVATEVVPPDAASSRNAASPAINSPTILETMLHTAPFTGLTLSAMEPQLAAFFGAPAHTGLLVQAVAANSPAAQAGIHAGDIVLRADALPLRNASDWLRRLHADKGKPMAVVVLRDHHELTLTLTPTYRKHSMLEWPAIHAGE